MAYPPPPPSVPAGKQRLRGRIPLRLALIFGVLGIAGLVVGVLLVKNVYSTIDGFKRVSIADGQGTVTLSSGKYVGYYEAPSGSGSVFVRLAIADASNGDAVNIGLYGKNANSSSSLTYTRNGKRGEALFKFDISHSGSYQVQVATDSGTAPAGADIAFGESIAGKLVAGIIVLIAGILLVIAAIPLLIVGLVKRSRHKKELASASYGPPPPGYGPPYASGYQPGYQPPPPPGYAPPQPGYTPPQSGYTPPESGYPPPPPA